MPGNMDLLNLSDEDKYYLKLLVAEHFKHHGSGCFKEDEYIVTAAPYAPPNMEQKSASPASKIDVTNEAGYFPTVWELGARIINYGASFFATPSPAPREKSPDTQREKITCYRSLSHNLLVQKEDGCYLCYLMDKKPFDGGAFGSISDSPGLLMIDTAKDDIRFIKTGNVIKHIQGMASEKLTQLINREASHLKAIYPETRLFQAIIAKKAPQNIFDAIMQMDHKADTEYWIVIPKIAGVSLEKYPVDNLTIAQKLKIALSLMWKLQQLHDPNQLGGVHIHNDIKPANIIISDDYVGDYCDYGGASGRNESLGGITQTPLYSMYNPKDIFRETRTTEEKADTHSLGITLFQLFLDGQQLPQGVKRWDTLPKGKHEKIKKNWLEPSHTKSKYQSVKLTDNEVGRFFRNLHGKTLTLGFHVTGLDNHQTKKLFGVLKGMRTKEGILLSEAYNTLLDIAKTVPDFESDYFSDKFMPIMESPLMPA
ncbi:Protein kinase domain protein [Legionella spiritensis]|uniref:Protein kinase domain protein n=2 Tax=Legionella spiritensis TaxID=452 RepID=A0A0W0Z6N2_LEGSP|nr:Protein kinase domain protein [Legionella spiritensis]SNV39795.1 Predicted ATPase [Legionella spiritensis]